MATQFFVNEKSIVRTIWGKSDTVLFIFAGAAAEFALNKAVDWLYFTGRLPADPLGRLFSTVTYARKIVFSPEEEAHAAIDSMKQIHAAVEHNRGAHIPEWAYRDVLFMLVHYSIASYELLVRRLQQREKEEVYQVFFRMGSRMHLKELPLTYHEWLPARAQHLNNNLQASDYTHDLFSQYRKHLGAMRYKILVEVQKMIVPDTAKKLLGFSRSSWLQPIMPLYKLSKRLQLDRVAKSLLLPNQYKKQIKALDVPH